uniref:Uncharacterized protein n=1 Tax=Haptolina ericina TaxID=156174 RepID=A0A7S3BYT2_9EUKA
MLTATRYNLLSWEAMLTGTRRNSIFDHTNKGNSTWVRRRLSARRPSNSMGSSVAQWTHAGPQRGGAAGGGGGTGVNGGGWSGGGCGEGEGGGEDGGEISREARGGGCG